MANPNGYFVDGFGQTTKNGVTVASDGSVSFVTHDSNGNQVVTQGGGNILTNPAWQHVGDLTVGSGAGTATLLPIGSALQVLQVNAGGNGFQYVTLSGGGNALTSNPLSQFAATTSAQLAATMSDETGTGSLVFNTSPTLVTPALGTPSSGTLTSCTGLPVSTGISGLAAGAATFLATPTSANLAALMTDETGTGANVFATSPTLVTPNLGTPSSVTLTNANGLPLTSGVTGVLPTANMTAMAASGVSHSAGIVPDPGASAGTTRFLCENATWAVPAGGGNVSNSGTPTTGQVAVWTGATTVQGVTATGTGSPVLATSPTLVTPALGTPSAAVLTNATGLPMTTGVTGVLPVANGGTGTTTPGIVAGTNITVTGTWPNQTVNSSAGGGNVSNTGTPTSGQVAIWTSATVVQGVTATGTGSPVLATSPTLTTPNLGTPSAATLTNATGLPISTGISGLGTGVATALAAGVTGSGNVALATSPTISAPTLSGIVTTSGSNITTANAMSALAIDVTLGFNTKTIAADSTFTFSGTPATANTWFSLHVTNSDTNPHTLTFPSSFSVVTQAARTSCVIPVSGQLWMIWRYDGTNYHIFGDGPGLSNFTATTNPTTSNDVTQGYMPGSLWANTSANTLYWCETSGAGAAVWNGPLGNGTVTSVALTTPSWLTVTGSPITTSGTLAVTATTGQTANQFLASPNGSTGAVSLRAIVPADVPVFVASGASHAAGIVPDPGSTAGTAKFLREDATWATPAGGGNVSNTGTPTSGQAAEWTSATVIQGVTVTGSGNYVKATSPTLTTPVLGTPTSGNLSNCTADGTNAVGFLGSPINSQSVAYTLVLADAGKTIMHPSADVTARTFTIPANASVAFPVGTIIGIKNQLSAGTLTIAITTDTLTKVGSAGGTGSRTLTAGGEASILKVDSTHWEICGSPELS